LTSTAKATTGQGRVPSSRPKKTEQKVTKVLKAFYYFVSFCSIIPAQTFSFRLQFPGDLSYHPIDNSHIAMDWFDKIKKRFTEPLPAAEGLAVPFEGNFTPRATQVLALARKEAERLNHNFFGTEHVLLGLIKLGQGVAVNVLMKFGLDLEKVRAEVEQFVGVGPEQKFVTSIPYTPRVKKVIALAQKEAKQLHHTYVGTEHLLLGLMREGDGVAAKVLQQLGVDITLARKLMLEELDPNCDPSQEKARETPSTQLEPSAIFQSKPESDERTALDTSKRYDVYCSEPNQVMVHRNVLFKRIKHLFIAHQYDSLSYFVELEQADGRTIFVAGACIIRFCEAEKI
jgi:hypothetical protein